MQEFKNGSEITPRVEFVRLSPDDWRRLRDLRVRAVTEEPRAFGKTPEEEMKVEESVWRERLAKGQYLFAKRNEELVGMVSMVRETGEKTRHIVNLYSVYLAPEARGGGIAGKLLQQAMDEAVADPTTVKFCLDVGVDNTSARALYERLGFEAIGIKRKELFVDGEYVDELAMERIIR